MLSTVNERHDDEPTKKTQNESGRMLVFASRVDRLAELALERLATDPDVDALTAAVADLVQLRALAQAVTR
jgi:hypothetical protein